jgi:hypothetical protein
MKYYVQIGTTPKSQLLSIDEIKQKVQTGEVSLDANCMNEQGEWNQIKAVLAAQGQQISWHPPSFPTAPTDEMPSGMAKASFVIGLVSIGVFVFIIILAVSIAANQINTASSNGNSNVSMDSNKALAAFLGMIVLLNMALNLVGFFLGMVALTRPISNQWMGITGAIINAVAFALILGLLVLGLSMRAHQSAQPTPVGIYSPSPGVVIV